MKREHDRAWGRRFPAILAAVPWLALGAHAASHGSPEPVSARECGVRSEPRASEPRPGPIRMEALDPSTMPPMFVMRGAPHAQAPIVVLHGMCSHGLGYAQSFQFSAAKHGLLIAPQGDKPCGGPWASWSQDLDTLDARIVRTFTTLGLADAKDVTLVGYSQGATRAEQLARKFPRRYSRLILIAAPDRPSPRGLEHLRGAVMMAGELDRRDLMNAAAIAFRKAGVPSTFQVIPNAKHGEMGPTPEATMGRALDWLWANCRPTPGESPSR